MYFFQNTVLIYMSSTCFEPEASSAGRRLYIQIWLVCCGMVWYGVVWYGVLWYGIVCCGMVWCGIVCCGMVWCVVV